MSTELHRHVNALVADFAAEYGEVDLVQRRVECGLREYDALVESFDAVGVVGGAGIRIVRDDEVLLVQYGDIDGWIDPGDGRRPGESYAKCAKRGVRRTTGIEARIDGLAQIQLVHLDDPSDRPPIPNPYVSFFGSVVSEPAPPDGTATAIKWTAEPPEELAYDELSELPLCDRHGRQK